jgi:GTP-binding protein HflX
VDRILIPDLREYRLAPDRLRGLRCVHTHLSDSPLNQDDLTDLALLAAGPHGGRDHDSGRIAGSRPLGPYPSRRQWSTPYRIMDPIPPFKTEVGCIDLIQALEAELARKKTDAKGPADSERALLVSVFTGPRKEAVDSLDELAELARTANISIIDTVLQQRKKPIPVFSWEAGSWTSCPSWRFTGGRH